MPQEPHLHKRLNICGAHVADQRGVHTRVRRISRLGLLQHPVRVLELMVETICIKDRAVRASVRPQIPAWMEGRKCAAGCGILQMAAICVARVASPATDVQQDCLRAGRLAGNAIGFDQRVRRDERW